MVAYHPPMASGGSSAPNNSGTKQGPFQGFITWLTSFNLQLPTAFSGAWLLAIPVIGLVATCYIFVYAQQVVADPWNVVGSALAFGAAAFLSGGLLGFLFGIPKAATSAAAADSEYTANTNLEQISNWVTTIVVGLTLTQLSRIPGALGRLADGMKAPLGGTDSSGDFGLALVIFYAVLGFLYLYLWSRTVLMGELARGDAAARQPDGADAGGAAAAAQAAAQTAGHAADAAAQAAAQAAAAAAATPGP